MLPVQISSFEPLAAMPMAWLGYDINRLEGLALVLLYFGYMFYLVSMVTSAG